MGFYISKVAPVYKNWQFQSISQGIDIHDWLDLVDDSNNIIRDVNDSERFNLYSIQNPSYFIHLWHNPQKGQSITFSEFPDRFKAEFVKSLYIICQRLGANLYSINEAGIPVEFMFLDYSQEIDKDYFFRGEKRFSDVIISENMSFIVIPMNDINEVVKSLNLRFSSISPWNIAVKLCYENKIMIRDYEDQLILIGQLKSLVRNSNDLDDENESDQDRLLRMLKDLSQKYGLSTYEFKSSRYGVVYKYQFKERELVMKYIYEDGLIMKHDVGSEKYFNEFESLKYDKTIQYGVRLYERVVKTE